MKKNLILTVLIVVGLGLSACAENGIISDPAGPGLQPLSQNSSLSEIGLDLSSQNRSVAEEHDLEGLLFMREEEKLARDVYEYLAEKWGMGIFTSIAKSEVSHMEAVLNLIENQDLSDPVGENGLGIFSNPDLQELYDLLVDQGSESLDAALLVGGAIEEIDILDLQRYLDQIDDPAIIQVYDNLLRGSIKHLGAFIRTYERQTGDIYQPQHLSQAELDQLLSQSGAGGNGLGQGRGSSPGGKGQSW